MTAPVAKAGTALWLHPRKCGLPFFIHYRPFVWGAGLHLPFNPPLWVVSSDDRYGC